MSDLSALAREYAEAKRAEAQWTERRRQLAAAIQEATGHKAENQRSYDAGDGWKVTVKAPCIRSVDWDKWEQVKIGIPAELWPVEMKPALDMSGVNWLRENAPEHYAVVAQCLTIKPGAVQVTVKEGE